MILDILVVICNGHMYMSSYLIAVVSTQDLGFRKALEFSDCIRIYFDQVLVALPNVSGRGKEIDWAWTKNFHESPSLNHT